MSSSVEWCLPEQRRRLIAEYVSEHEWASAAEVAEVFNISLATVRRDLIYLAQQKGVVRVRGGAGRVGAASW